MAKEDEILKAFMRHSLLKDEYGLKETDIPKTVEEGIRSDIPIVQAIAIIVKGTQRVPMTTDTQIQAQVIQILSKK